MNAPQYNYIIQTILYNYIERLDMSSSLRYRPDIDGLRAFAVLAVVIFHINSEWLPGGFLGVDVFFVISGFLITSIINRQAENNTFSLLQFYTKRIKRILPLFFGVLLVVVIVAMILLLPEDYERFWRTARYSMQFRGNRAFLGDDYFDVGVEEKPLLHIWSLAIEEQFYFVWPFVFVGLFFLLKEVKSRKKYLFLLAIVGIITSTTVAEYSLHSRPEDSYYLLRNRIAELLVGCALALIPFSLPSRVKRYLGVIGFATVVSCFFIYNSSVPIPGVYILLPVFATALYLQDDSFNSRYKSLLSCAPLRWIGVLSFSIYLWHWPVLAFVRYVQQDNELSPLLSFFALFLTLILSITSYYLLENPIRKLKWGFLKSILIIYLLPFTFIWGLNYLHINYLQEQEIAFFENRQGCFDSIEEICQVGDKDASDHYLLVGDSHAMHLSEMLDKIGKEESIQISIITAGGCKVGFGVNIDVSKHPQCIAVNEYLTQHWQEYDAVLFSMYSHLYLKSGLHDPSYIEDLSNTVQSISLVKPVIFFLDIPSKGYNPRRYLRHKLLGITFKKFTPEVTNNHIAANQIIIDNLKDIRNVRLIDLASLFDDRMNDDGTYHDQHHLSAKGSKILGELFLEKNSLLEDN